MQLQDVAVLHGVVPPDVPALEAVAAVVEDPIRFLTLVSECEDAPDAIERVSREYAVIAEIATHMLEVSFWRVTTIERAKLDEEITMLRERLAV